MYGKYLSQPQAYAVEWLDAIAQREIEQSKVVAYQLARISGGMFIPPNQVFPELFATEEVEDDTEAIDESTDQYGEPIAVVYDFSKAKYDPEEVDRLMREMASSDSMINSSFSDVDY